MNRHRWVARLAALTAIALLIPAGASLELSHDREAHAAIQQPMSTAPSDSSR